MGALNGSLIDNQSIQARPWKPNDSWKSESTGGITPQWANALKASWNQQKGGQQLGAQQMEAQQMGWQQMGWQKVGTNQVGTNPLAQLLAQGQGKGNVWGGKGGNMWEANMWGGKGGNMWEDDMWGGKGGNMWDDGKGGNMWEDDMWGGKGGKGGKSNNKGKNHKWASIDHPEKC